ncbi:uncharacterized protein METZ01_LOCUS236198, partial [marine metagenome]
MQIPRFSTLKKTPVQIFDKIYSSPINTNPSSLFLIVFIFFASKILSHLG